ncbi:hypothetical protein AAC387_Pa09g0647 [Persea americana]
MRFLKSFFRLPKPLEKTVVSIGRTNGIIPYFNSVHYLLPDFEMGCFSSLHQLQKAHFSTETMDQNAFIIKQNSVDPEIISPYELGRSKSIQGLTKPQFFVESVDDNPPYSQKKIAEEADLICRMLVNEPKSSVCSSLNNLDIRVSPQLVEEVLKKLGNAGILALSFFRWAENKDGFRYTTETFHALIEALGKIKQFRLIWNLVDTMKHTSLLTRETFALITRKYARARKIKEAIEAFERMSKYGLEPQLSDFNRLIDTISKSKHVKRAHEIFDDMKKKRFSPDLKTYTILLEGLGQERNLLKMMEVYREMKDEGFQPDAVTYGILINAYCKAMNYEEAINLFHEMEAKNCPPTPHIYCTLINGLGSNKRLNDALKFFELSKASGFAPEIPTYNAVVGSYCCAMQFEDAFRVVEEMKKCGVGSNSRTYDVIIHHLIKARKTKGRLDKAMKVWKQMNDKGVLPCMHMFSALINGLCDENRLEEACNYFEEMLDKGIRPPGSLYSNLKEALLDAGMKDMALKMGERLDILRKTALEG